MDMMEATSTARGNARLTKRAEANTMSLRMIHASSPLPINSSAYTHKNCMSKMNSATGNVTAKGPKNDRNMSLVILTARRYSWNVLYLLPRLTCMAATRTMPKQP